MLRINRTEEVIFCCLVCPHFMRTGLNENKELMMVGQSGLHHDNLWYNKYECLKTGEFRVVKINYAAKFSPEEIEMESWQEDIFENRCPLEYSDNIRDNA